MANTVEYCRKYRHVLIIRIKHNQQIDIHCMILSSITGKFHSPTSISWHISALEHCLPSGKCHCHTSSTTYSKMVIFHMRNYPRLWRISFQPQCVGMTCCRRRMAQEFDMDICRVLLALLCSRREYRRLFVLGFKIL